MLIPFTFCGFKRKGGDDKSKMCIPLNFFGAVYYSKFSIVFQSSVTGRLYTREHLLG